jgi:hypothetical protein
MLSKIIQLNIDSTLKNAFELKNSEKDPSIQLIIKDSKIEKIDEKKMGFLYIHRKEVQNLLYDFDKIINIDLSDNFKFSDIFYLILLINEDKNFVTYKYSFDFINNLETIFKMDDSKNDLIKSKIIYELTKNLESNKDNKNIEKTKIKFKDSFGEIEGLNVYDNKTVNVNIIFDKKNLDEIYGDILDALIRTNNFVDYKFSYNIIKKLDLENIYITETIFNKLYKTFNNEDSVKNYVINFIKDDINNKIIDDLNNNEKKINFYYILFKYIFKNPIYIYHIPFLNNARLNIMKNKTFLSISKQEISLVKKLKYIYSFFYSNNYYIKNLFKNKNHLESGSKSKSNDSKNTKESVKSISTLYNEEEFFYQIMEYKKTLLYSDNKLNYKSIMFMKQMNNGNILTWGNEDSITIIKENYEIETISYSENLVGQLSSKEKKAFKEFKKTVHISEIINYSDPEKIGIIDCSKYALLIYILNLRTGIITLERKKDISCKQCLGINKQKDDRNEIEYIVIGEKGIIFLDQEFIEKKNRAETNISFIEGIKITDKLIALTSNSILPSGEDKLIFYNIEQKKEEQTIEGSFVNNTNGLALVEIKANETKEYKILFCACKSYNKNQKNGILLVKPSLENDKDLSYKFYRTETFEVNCICPINNSGDKNNTIYFFAGGLDIEISLPMIKLFKVIYDHESNRFDVLFLQNIEIEKINEFKGFERSITCMMQNKKDECILVGTSDGKEYVFSEPNLKYYIEDYEEKLVHLFNKKNSLKELR